MGSEMGVKTDSVLISHWHSHLVVGRRLTRYMGHVECRLVYACSFFFFFFHDRTTCMHRLVVGFVTPKNRGGGGGGGGGGGSFITSQPAEYS